MCKEIWQPMSVEETCMFFTNRKLPLLHSESVPRSSLSKASTHSYAEKNVLLEMDLEFNVYVLTSS